MKEGFGLVRSGKAITRGELHVEKGDYLKMESNVRLPVLFFASF
jgi:hypothetical protein